jgi:6-phosphogluconolactonase
MASEIAALEVVPDAEALAVRARELFVEDRPTTVALAGGETPRRTYGSLAASRHPWEETEVFVTDERCVPLDHPMSNYRMISETLLSKVPARGHPVRVDLDPEDAAQDYERRLTEALPLEFVFLGLGSDGHTASLFPSDPAHTRRDRLVAAVTAPATGGWRVTLTLAALDTARRAVFLVSGESKGEALGRLLRGDPIPATLVRPKGEVTVLADQAAAEGAKVG